MSEEKRLLPFKIWGITLILGAFFFFLTQLFNGLGFFESLSFGFIAFFLSLLLSFPSFLIYLVFFIYVINRNYINKRFRKTAILLVGLLLLVGTFTVMEIHPIKSQNREDLAILCGYIAALAIATFITKLSVH